MFSLGEFYASNDTIVSSNEFWLAATIVYVICNVFDLWYPLIVISDAKTLSPWFIYSLNF